jgi:nitroreductase
MDAMEALLTRRSVRSYTDAPVPDSAVNVLLEAAMSAPSAGNQQPWQFVLVTDRDTLISITRVHPYAGMLKQAPLAVIVCGDLDRERFKGYWVQDCSAATQNLLIAARAQGLGAVWLGVYPLEDRINGLRDLMGLPDTIIPLSVVSIGYPAVAQGPADRYDGRLIHLNRWGGKGPNAQ